MRYFYSHLISIESLIVELDTMELTEKEKKHLASLIDANLHQTILDAILSELNEEDKRLFLHHLHEGKHDEVWELLNKKASDIQTKIINAANLLKNELHEDINSAKILKKD